MLWWRKRIKINIWWKVIYVNNKKNRVGEIQVLNEVLALFDKGLTAELRK